MEGNQTFKLNKDNWLRNDQSIQYHIEVRPYNLKELSGIYELTPKTLRKYLDKISDKIGEKLGRYFTVLQVEVIFAHLGMPYKVV
jgi:hypothetical protein